MAMQAWKRIIIEDEYYCEYRIDDDNNLCGGSKGTASREAHWRREGERENPDDPFGYFLCDKHYYEYVDTDGKGYRALAKELGYEPDPGDGTSTGGNKCRWQGLANCDGDWNKIDNSTCTPKDHTGYCARWQIIGSENAQTYTNIRLCDKHLAALARERKPVPFESDYEKIPAGNFCRWEGYKNTDKEVGAEGQAGHFHSQTSEGCDGHATWRIKGTGLEEKYANVRLCSHHKGILDERKRTGGRQAKVTAVATPELEAAIKASKKIDQLLQKFAGTPRALRIEVERELYGDEECYKRLKRECLV